MRRQDISIMCSTLTVLVQRSHQLGLVQPSGRLFRCRPPIVGGRLRGNPYLDRWLLTRVCVASGIWGRVCSSDISRSQLFALSQVTSCQHVAQKLPYCKSSCRRPFLCAFSGICLTPQQPWALNPNLASLMRRRRSQLYLMTMRNQTPRVR